MASSLSQECQPALHPAQTTRQGFALIEKAGSVVVLVVKDCLSPSCHSRARILSIVQGQSW